jgi:hypothetical protein
MPGVCWPLGWITGPGRLPSPNATTKTDYKVTAALFLAFFALIVIGNLWLAGAFDFPDILRQPAAERFARFQAKQGRSSRPTT